MLKMMVPAGPVLVSTLLALACPAHSAATTTRTSNNSTSPLVTTSLFRVQGFVDPAIPNVNTFLGIPYAEPPVGSLRWRPPQTKKPETGVINATAYGDCCIQASFPSGQQSIFTDYLLLNGIPEGYPTSEDCLSLNVWTPTTEHNALLPVMVWIHGGGLNDGCSNTPFNDGAYIVRNHQDVIVVSIKSVCSVGFSCSTYSVGSTYLTIQ
jgi:carboxylesterase type B